MNTKRTLAATAIIALMLAGIGTVTFAHPNGTSIFQQQQQSQQDQTSTSTTTSTTGTQSTTTTTTESTSTAAQNTTSSEHKGNGQQHENKGQHQKDHKYQGLNLKVGDTISLSNLTGRFMQVTNQSIRGNASGALIFTVTGVFKAGYTFSISGTIYVGDKTYTIDSGSAQVGPYGKDLVGHGTAGSGVQFLIHATISEDKNAAAASHGVVMIDLQNPSGEYEVLLGTTPVEDEANS